MKFLIFYLVAVMVVAKGYAQSSGVVLNVSVDEFKEAMDSLDGEIIIDLRTPDELKDGRIEGAIVIDFFGVDFEPAIAALDTGKVYLLYCASGGRSGETAELMQNMGFRKIYNLETGFRGWLKRKMPVKK